MATDREYCTCIPQEFDCAFCVMCRDWSFALDEDALRTQVSTLSKEQKDLVQSIGMYMSAFAQVHDVLEIVVCSKDWQSTTIARGALAQFAKHRKFCQEMGL